jgi:outer membrane protein assembly factor BamB
MNKHLISLLIPFLLVSTSFTSISFSEQKDISMKQQDYCLPEFYSSNSSFEQVWYQKYLTQQKTVITAPEKIIQYHGEGQDTRTSRTDGGLMNSSWPMQSHDVYHTGRSPYSTANNLGVEIWNYLTNSWTSSPVIDKDGTIYIGADGIYAIYPNGTLKWEYITCYVIKSAPVIDENGTIYFGTIYGTPNYFYAVYPNGTLKWKFVSGSVFSSPVITHDGAIIFTDSDDRRIVALYPNGTEKWEFHTNMSIYSSPAIGVDGTIFCGSHDHNVYALYPNNGTLKWQFTTENWVHGSPTIGSDGTVYIGSDDGYLYALYPNNGSMKWRCNIGECDASPALDKNGTLYVGVWEKEFYAIYPNGTIKWSFNPGAKIWGSSAAISDDGTIYFGTCDLESSWGIEIIALNSDGTVKWRNRLNTVFSSPAIGKDGTVYIGSFDVYNLCGYLNAFGRGPLRAEANGPYVGDACVPIQLIGTIYGGIRPYTCQWDFGDGYTSNAQNPTHNYSDIGSYNVTFTVIDSEGNMSTDTATVSVFYAPPTIMLTKPSNAIYVANIPICQFFFPFIIGPLMIKVTASELPLGIDRVEFYVDNNLMSTDIIPPYRWMWMKVEHGSVKHDIMVVAYDKVGHSAKCSIDVIRLPSIF